MSVQVIDNFSYKGKKGNFERDNFDTLQAMRSYPEDGIDEGHVCFCNEDGNHYKFNRLNRVDGTTGRWRLHNKSVNTLTETGEGKVLDARQGKILKDLIDAKVIEAGGVSFDIVPTKGSTNPVTSNGIREAMDEQAESINSNMGVDEYPVFSTAEDYKSGDTVNYQGKLYQFTSDHNKGAWTGTDVEETDVIQLLSIYQKGYFNSNHIYVKSNTSLCVKDLPVKAGEQYVYSGKAYQSGLFLKREDGSFIDYTYNNVTYEAITVTITEDGLLSAWGLIDNNFSLYKVEPVTIEQKANKSYIGSVNNSEYINNFAKLLNRVSLNLPYRTSLKKDTSNVRYSLNLDKSLLEENDLIQVELSFSAEIYPTYIHICGVNYPIYVYKKDGIYLTKKYIVPITKDIIDGNTDTFIQFGTIKQDCTAEYTNETCLLKRYIEPIDYTSVLEYPYKGYSAMIPLTVKKDGSGDFTTIQEAINSIDDASIYKQYDIQVFDDFIIKDVKDLYTNDGKKNTSDNPLGYVAIFFTKNYVHVRGMKGHGTKLYVEPSNKNLNGNTFRNIHTIFAQGNCIINNFYVGIKGGRYAIHQESNGKKDHLDYHAHTIYMNLVCEHKGNSEYTNGTGWTSVQAIGNGLDSGLKLTFLNCKFIAPYRIPFYFHTNKDFDEPCEIKMTNCSAIITSKDVSLSNIGITFSDMGSGQCSKIELNGCKFPKFTGIYSYGGIYGNEESSNERIRLLQNGGAYMVGMNNSPMPVIQIQKQALTFYSVKNNEDVDVVGGTAYDTIWVETMEQIKATEVNQGYCVGSVRLQKAASTSQITTLSYLLGNCANSPKTLIVRVNGEDYTITFDKNYMTSDGSDYSWNTVPYISMDEIVNQINELYPDIFKASRYMPVNEFHTFNDCEELGINVDTKLIDSGCAVVRDDTTYQGWKLAQEGDKAEGIAGYILPPSVNGENIYANIINPKKALFTAVYYGLNISKGNYIKVINEGKLSKTANKDEASFIAIDDKYFSGI